MEQRQAVRAVLLDPTGAVLMMRVVEPMTRRPWWVTPGGGIDEGEDHPAALRRELREEIAFDVGDTRVGPAVWHRRLVLPWNGRRIQQFETYYVLETERFEPAQCVEGDAATGWLPAVPRWWTTDELRASDEDIAPRRFADLLDDLRDVGRPSAPIDIT